MKSSFNEMHLSDFDRSLALQLLERDGYIVIRSGAPTSEINALLTSICQLLADVGWIDDHSILERIAIPERACAEPDNSFRALYEQVFALEALHRFPHLAALTWIMAALVGEDVLVHPKHAVRLVFPNYEPGRVKAHQDHSAVQGDPRCYTAWVPLHDCPIECGPLAVLSGSHLSGLQPTPKGTGYIPLAAAAGRQWVEGGLKAGDILIFNSLTVHQALPNRSQRIRVSVDFRFQSQKHKVNPAAFVFPGSGRKSWEKVYSAWKSQDLQYYWRSYALNFSPTIDELSALSLEAESPEMQTRYANIRERLLLQMERVPFVESR